MISSSISILQLMRSITYFLSTSIVEPLFDLDDTKTLVLLFLIKLLSVSKMNLTLKAKDTLRVLKIQYSGDGFESHMKRIRISILECHQNVSEKTRFESEF